MALLGKISAVLTANTQDFSRNLGVARRELNAFAQQARGLQLNLDNRALNQTLTQLQRAQRTIQQIERQRAQGLGAGLPDPNRLRRQLQIFEDVGKPLTQIKTQFEGLSVAVQAQLTPALTRLQAGFQNTYNAADTTRERIDSLRNGVIALGRAVAATGDLDRLSKSLNANNSGASFFQARAKEALQQSLSLRDQAEKVPARFRSDAFADLAVAAEEGAERVARAAARVARAQLAIARNGGQATPRQLIVRSVAQDRLNRAVAEQEQTNNLFRRELVSSQIKEIVSPAAISQVENLTERFGKLAVALREGNDTRFDGLIANVGRLVEQLNRGEASARKVKAAVDSLEGASFLKSFGAGGFDAADKSLSTDSERTRARIRSQAQALRNTVIGDNPNLGRRRRNTLELINQREDIALSREEFNREGAGRIGDLRSRVGKLGAPELAKDFDNLRSLGRDVNASLKAAFDARGTDRAGEALDRYKSKFAALLPEIDRFEKKLKSAETANRRFGQFLEISGSRGDKLGADLERAASDISVARQFRGNFDAGNIEGRRNVAAGIEKQLQTYQKAAELQQRIADRTFKSEATRARALERVTAVIEGQRAALRNLVVEQSKGAVSAKQFDAAAARAAKNRGSFGIAGIATAQLALQQGLFAIDDFISSTGGLEYKLRAVGNNITQLGLLLGQSGLIPGLSATTGLFIGLAAVLGGQVASAFARFINDSEALDQKLKVLNSSLESQQNTAKELANAYKELGDSIRNSSQSEIGREESSLEKKIAELAELRKKLAIETAASIDPEVSGLRAKRGVLQSQLERETSIPERVRIQRNIDRSRAEEERIISRLSSQANPEEAVQNLRGAGESGVKIAESALRGLQFAFATPPAEADLAAARDAIKRAQDAGAASAAIGNFNINDTAAAAKALKAIRDQVDSLQDLRESPGVVGRAGLEADIDKVIERLLKDASRLQARLSGAFDAIDAKLTRASQYAAREIDSGLRAIGEAFGESISSSSIRAELDRLGDVLGQLQELRASAATPDEAEAYQADIDAVRAHASELLIAAKNVRAFAAAFDKVIQQVSPDVAALEQRAEEQRRAVLGGRAGPGGQRLADQARRDADLAARRERELQDEAERAREVVEARLRQANDPVLRRRQEIDRQLAVPAGEIAPDGTKGGTAEERDRLRAERRRLDRQIQQEIDNSPEMADARRRRDEVNAQLERAQSVDRGRELQLNPAERAGRDLAQGLRDLQAAFEDDRAAGLNPDRGELGRDARRLRDEAFRFVAPDIFRLADSVQNAVLQGPSRAALQVADVTTSEGARELNRLLRGDDSAKNENLVELQKQSQSLDELVRIAKENSAPPGLVDL